MIKKFQVTESNSKDFLGKLFETPTQIRQNVGLPFTEGIYRCTMFDGIRIRLVSEDGFIIGMVR